MSYKLGLKCYLIEPADKFLLLLSKPISTILNSVDSHYNLHSKWTYYFIELYNNRLEFLLMGETRVNGRCTETSKVFKNTYKENYTKMVGNFDHIHDLNIWEELDNKNDDHIVFSLDQKKSYTNNRMSSDMSMLESVNKSIDNENRNKQILENTMLRLVVFIYQYVNKFEEDSININLWNYSLRSMTFSPRCFVVGICTLLCQYILSMLLLYSVITDFNLNSEIPIVLITIISTLISILYCYNTICSYVYASPMYRFLLQMYDDYPELVLNHEEKNNIFYKKKTITMKKWHIKYNWWADFFSNFVLPICIPVINLFVIANSESIVDAILNSVAIFFIIQIDEDLLSITPYENEKNTIHFIRWITGVIYCKHFPLFKDIFKLEYDSWCNNAFNVSKKFKKNKVANASVNDTTIVINATHNLRHISSGSNISSGSSTSSRSSTSMTGFNDTGSSEIDERIFERKPTLRKTPLPHIRGSFDSSGELN